MPDHLLHYLYQIIDQVKKVKDGNFEIQIAESSQDEIGELAENIIKATENTNAYCEVYKSKLDKKAWNWICFSQRLTRIFFITIFPQLIG